MTNTSDGLIALLKRKGIDPTGDRVKDLILARSVMPKPFKDKSNDGHIHTTNSETK
jgi:hypothetical protein